MSQLISPRIWGRSYAQDGSYTWIVVKPDPNGNTDFVYVTNLIQVFLLVLGESPFFANYGIPAQQSIVTQIFPDFYVNQTQQQFAQYFASLQISKVDSTNPFYRVKIVTQTGTPMTRIIPI